ncbi:hypothetical protein [Clostridium kluyveri]|uniref:Uncharacterized protein n=1 Tax=Clostridium kluyveri TaxID=1534 RepID=A0A1L5FCH2_CLOKL|nr:hypothetical protein [Clostridium kluyveri]APM40712.1 hypothetical protein BS101_19290 [Clostridium kluyveri]
MEKLTLKELLKEIKAEKFAEILPYNARKALRASGLKRNGTRWVFDDKEKEIAKNIILKSCQY